MSLVDLYALSWMTWPKTDNAERFRDEAEECRRQAERTIGPLVKETRLAGEWLKLAQDADARRRKP
jgi:hypothetical protein